MRLRSSLIGAAMLVAATAAGVPLAGQALAATPACQVDYAVGNSWAGGFQAGITITNNAAPLTSWTLAFQFANGQTVANGWNGTFTQDGAQVTVASQSYNGSLGTGGSATIGMVGTWIDSNSVPDYFTVNGTACNGALQRPTVSLTSPAPNTTVTSPATVQLAANAASTSGGSITRVEFYDGTTLVGTDTTAPYAASLAGVAPGVHMYTAKAYDSDTATATTVPAAGVFVHKPGRNGAPALHVSGNKLVDAAGNAVVLHGVNRSGAEFQCVHGYGIFDGPVTTASVLAIASWNVTAVRVPLNEDCWLGLSNVQSQYAGTAYQTAIGNYVALLHQYDINVILDLHWSDGVYSGPASACTDATAACQKPMPDAANAVPFWKSVAAAFKGDNATLFDLFNEAYPDAAANWAATPSWTCWRDGGSCTGIGYPVAGMQTLVNAVRATGATNPIMLGGLRWANDMTQWLQFKPADPTGNLVASWHSYNFNACIAVSCWDSQIAPVAASVPLLTGEIGENECGHSYIDSLMGWADSHSIGYLGWTWNTWSCATGSVLITSYDGTPTTFGIGLRDHLRALG
ncbi:MAG TPA: cellulose binding domain-containing protein [Rugosimonospora sp.]|nr:cellulose binding domain-containing protein [Rugosimonospora sp.]